MNCTGVSSDSLVCAELSHVQLFVTPWTVARQVPLSMGFSRQEYCSGWVAVPSSRGPSQPRDGTCVSRVSCIGRRVLTTSDSLEGLNL